VAQTDEPRKQDHLPPVVGQLVERPLEPPRLLVAHRDLTRARAHDRPVAVADGRRTGGVERSLPGLPCRVALLGLPVALLLDDLSERHGVQPGLERPLASVLEASRILEQLAAVRLHEVGLALLRPDERPGAKPDEGPQARKVFLKEHVHRVRFTLRRRLDELSDALGHKLSVTRNARRPPRQH
jgi:hypothetical protein